MQSYKTWIGRYLEQPGNGGKLARMIHDDPHFPEDAGKLIIRERLRQLNASEGVLVVFGASWKDYLADAKKKPKEVTLESRLSYEVEKRGGLCWKFVSPGVNGVPDRIVITPDGRVAFVEMKAPHGKLQPIQRKRASELIERGADWHLLKSLSDIERFLREVFGE